MTDVTTFVGIDAHKKELYVAMLVGGSQSPVTWTVANEPNAVRRLVRQLEREAVGPVQCCYEAGPGGYALQRQLTTDRVRCQVIAPALIPAQAGGSGQDRSSGCAQAGGVAAGGVTDRGTAADACGGSGP